MAAEAVNYIGEDLAGTGKVLAAALLAASGKAVQVAPLEDENVARFGVWLRGEPGELEEVQTALEEALGEDGVAFVVTPYQVTGERG